MTFSSIKYPNALKKNETIGVTAPSSGLGNETFIKRFELVTKHFNDRGYQIIEGKCLRKNNKATSASPKERQDDLLNLWANPAVKAIIPPWGGQTLIEILPTLDFEKLEQSDPKWILGYSDTSTLLFAITTKTGIATAHGINFMDLIGTQNDSLSAKTLDILNSTQGDEIRQVSSDKFQKQFINFSDCLEANFNLTEPTQWKSLNFSGNKKFSGRLIGGCIDTICYLVGTPFGNLENFKQICGNDGHIFYLENCHLHPYALTRALWQMRSAGWFEGASGILLGRNNAEIETKTTELNYLECISNCLGDLGIPVVYEADIGHKPPNMTLINGAKAVVEFTNDKTVLTQSLI